MAAPPSSRSRLLRLSAELRNRIWEYALTEANPILVTKSGFPEPALLFTNHQIRRETRAMFFALNEFAITTPNWDPSNICEFSAVKIPKDVPLLVEYLAGDNRPVWNNLMRWFKAYHDGRTNLILHGHPNGPFEMPDPSSRVTAQAFDLIQELYSAGNSWETIEKSLQILKKATQELVHWE